MAVHWTFFFTNSNIYTERGWTLSLGLGHVGVIGAQPALVYLQGAAVVVLHLLVLALVLAQQRQVVQLLGHVRVVLTQDLVVGNAVQSPDMAEPEHISFIMELE